MTLSFIQLKKLASSQIVDWLSVLLYIAVGFLVGAIFEKVILSRISKASEKSDWKGYKVLIHSFRNMPLLWFGIAGMFLSVHKVELSIEVMNIFHKVLLAAIVLSATVFAARVGVGFVDILAEKYGSVITSTSILENLTLFFIYAIGLMVLLNSLGISIAPILTALGVGGLAVALALQDTLSNLFSGIYIILTREINKGDYVKLNSGEEGYIADITWRNTTIKALSNNMIIIPNSKLANSIITNYMRPEKEMSVLVQVGVGYGSDLEKVERVTNEVSKEVLTEVEGGVPEFDPFIRFHTFGDSSINFSVILRTREFVGQYLLKHEFVKRLHKRFRQEGIKIPFPIRTVEMKGGVLRVEQTGPSTTSTK